jgi:hypothetical protein
VNLYLLDTNIASVFDPRERDHHPELIRWLHANDRRLFLSSISLFEIENGRWKLIRDDKLKRASEIASMRQDLQEALGDRVLPVSADVAVAASALEHAARGTIDPRDLLIAATAQVHGLTVLTRNLRHFEPTGVPVLDPLASLP